jgi:hypothetical protein
MRGFRLNFRAPIKMPSSSYSHCRRRAIPWPIKVQILVRQGSCCADCGARLAMGSFVFDHRPPLALREAYDDANDPERLAAICLSCNGWKTRRDLRDIAQAKRYGLIRQAPRQEADDAARRVPTPELNAISPDRLAIIQLLLRRSSPGRSHGIVPDGAAGEQSIQGKRCELDAVPQRADGGEQPGSPHEAAVLRAAEYWAREAAGLGSWPPFSRSDLT